MEHSDLPEQIIPSSPDFQTELAEKIAEIAPEVIIDGKLDIAKLRELVNGDAETSPEKFGLFWPGKQRAQATAQTSTSATLVPVMEESEDWDTTKNIFIEGDNLEVLKALQNSYRRKVKMIYIDPPYNTGKEFIYPDNFQEGLQSYLEYTGQKNEAGENTESKKETSGRKHSNWLSMMYPRLQLAKSLLTDDGVIFISIDDNEDANLRRICDEVFDEDNFIAQIIWERAYAPINLKHHFSESHDYILCYARNKESINKLALTRSDEADNRYKNPDSDLRGPWKMSDFSVGPANQKNIYEITTPSGRTVSPPSGRSWVFSEKRTQELIVDNRVWFGSNGNNIPAYKRFLSEVKQGVTPMTIWKYKDVGHSQDATKEVKELFDGIAYFEYPKPTKLIKQLLDLSTKDNDIIMDFFSGSGTTADAVIQLNAQNNGSRTHIQVQLPELTDRTSEAYKAGYKTISDIAKERIRRAAKKIREDYADKIAERNLPLDTGFRVYKLAPSNFVEWDEQAAAKDPEQAVLDFAANKKPDAAPEALLAEIILQSRLPLSSTIEKRELQSGGWVYIVDGGNLIAYVANEQIAEEQAREIADLTPAKLVILDNAFNGNDALKINVANICKDKGIKGFKTI